MTDFFHTVDKNDDFKLFQFLITDEIRNVNAEVEDNKNGSDIMIYTTQMMVLCEWILT